MLRIPVAMNCWVYPAATEDADGVTTSDVTTGGFTRSVAEALNESDAAVMVAVPCATPVASPLLLIVATDMGDDDHVTELVMVCVLPLLKVPFAVNCSLSPEGMEPVVGLTETDVKTGAVTVNEALPLILLRVAVIVAPPWSMPRANPLPMVATEVAEELHLATVVRFCVVPLLYVPVAVNCWVYPAGMEDVAGVTAIETKDGAVPLPVSVTSCGLEIPLSTMVRVAARDPMAVGVNVIEIVQLPPAASVAGLMGQLLVET